jgi:hypothetical protein
MELFEKPGREVIAYAAGALDGDGCVHINRQGNRYSLHIFQSAQNGGENWCRWFGEQWKLGNVHGERKASGSRVGRFGASLMWSWNVTRINQCEFVLHCLLPFLHIRKPKALEALEHFRSRTGGLNKGTWYDPEVQFIKDNWLSIPDREIATRLDRSLHAIRARRVSLGLIRRSQ